VSVEFGEKHRLSTDTWLLAGPVSWPAVGSRRVVVAVLLAVLVFAGGACSGKPHPLASGPVPELATTTTTAKPAVYRQVAMASVPKVEVFKAPGDTAAVGALKNPTAEGYPLAFLAVGQAPDWVQVRLPTRPNGVVGWIKASDVTLGETPQYRVQVSLGARQLTLFRGDEIVMQEPVGVGKARTPTPTGSFYIDILVKLRNPNTVWGPYQLSVSGFSNVLERFAGGVGQIAIHGTNAPGLIPGDISNGCVRMKNDAITRLVDHGVGVGTPVDIIA
jgi:lipoprotein-anchoring transpeptidase ErfK/SrfK